MYSDADGELAVRLAREAIEAHTRGRTMAPFSVPASFEKESGCFVTLNTYPQEELRGCIGYPEPYYPLAKAIVKAAEGATEDPRFPRLAVDELDRVVVEVSVLTPPEMIEVKKAKLLPQQVRVGVDGLIAARGRERGLLLPQVAVDWGWDAQEFLSQTCVKAGLLPDAWLEAGTRVYKFQSEVFTEAAPRRGIVRRLLGADAST